MTALAVGVVETINLATPRPNPEKPGMSTGIGKHPYAGSVQVRAPGPKVVGGLGSGLVGDYVGDRKSHGGDQQAVYAYSRDYLDVWQERLGRELPNGFFGENLSVRGLGVDQAIVGEQWQIGEQVVLTVTVPRIPCTTFRGQMADPQWMKTFTADAHPGAYFEVTTPGSIQAGDRIQVIFRPAHQVSIQLMFRALTTEPQLMPELAAAGDYLTESVREKLAAYRRSVQGESQVSAIE